MSFVRNYIVDDEYVECPICNEYIQLELGDIDTFKSKKTVNCYCYNCNTYFYLENTDCLCQDLENVRLAGGGTK